MIGSVFTGRKCRKKCILSARAIVAMHAMPCSVVSLNESMDHTYAPNRPIIDTSSEVVRDNTGLRNENHRDENMNTTANKIARNLRALLSLFLDHVIICITKRCVEEAILSLSRYRHSETIPLTP